MRLEQKEPTICRRDRIAHAMLTYPFSSSEVNSRGAVQAAVDVFNEWTPPENRFSGFWTPDNGEHTEENDGKWLIASNGQESSGYQSLCELEAPGLALPEERSALAALDLVMFTFCYWRHSARSRLLRSHLPPESLTYVDGDNFEQVAHFSRTVSYVWNEDFESKRVLGLSLLATSGSPAQKGRRALRGTEDVKKAAFAWGQLFRMYTHEAEVWEPVRVEPTKKTCDGLVFWVAKEPVDSILERLLNGRLRDSVALGVGRELLRWVCLAEKA
jgi:hypothetical protein